MTLFVFYKPFLQDSNNIEADKEVEKVSGDFIDREAPKHPSELLFYFLLHLFIQVDSVVIQ